MTINKFKLISVKTLLYFFLFLSLIMLFNCSDKNLSSNYDPPSIGPIDYTFFDEDAAWSPDGSQIAYIHCDTTICGIFVIDTSGSNRKMIYQSGKAYSPRWSPDGQWIVFVDNKQIFKMKINGDSLTQLTFEGWNRYPDWSSDGKWIVFDYADEDSSCMLKIINKSNPNISKCIYSSSFYYLKAGIWFDNSNSLLCIGKRKDEDFQKLFIIDTNSILIKEIGISLTNHEFRDMKYSANNNSIVTTIQPYASPQNIYSINKDGSNLRQLTTGSCISPDWSPDGKYIVYSALVNKKGYLWIMDKDGANKRQLTF